jgi:6-phospho-3-hexuloisomerase
MDSTDQQNEQMAKAVHENLKHVLAENITLAENIDYTNFGDLIGGIQSADAIFIIASGRSGYSMRSAAMRLMHLGLRVYFVGDTTTPAIKAGDLLWAASGSGTTSTIVKAAEKARQVGANVVAVTTNASSILASIANTHIQIPAAEKQDHDGVRSKQYAGSLFEQALLLIGDAVFMELWKINGTPAEELWKRHANME